MDYETLIFSSASACIPSLFLYFVIVTILDYIRTMLFSNWGDYMFVNEDYSDFKYVVGVSDNYLILSDVDHVNADWNNQRTINVIYQYLTPSFLTIEATRTFNTTTYFSEVETSQSFFSRADCNAILLSQFLVIFFVAFIFNGLTRFVRKGGALFGS